MNIQSQVTSLGLSRRLKELGAKQESHFYWRIPHDALAKVVPEVRPYLKVGWAESPSSGWYTVAAFTTAELGEILPMSIGKSQPQEGELSYRIFTSWNDTEGWSCAYCMPSGAGDYALHVADTEAEARGLTLEYLIKNNLLSV